MTTVYFITFLLLTTNTVPEGWLNWHQPFTDKIQCELALTQKKDLLFDSLNGFLDGKLVEVKRVECLTPDEIAKRNTELGHLPRANLK